MQRIQGGRASIICMFQSLLVLGLLLSIPAQAQQITGVPGSPDATTTISGKQLPPPAPKFGGVIKDNRARSPSHGGRRVWCRPKARPTSC